MRIVGIARTLGIGRGRTHTCVRSVRSREDGWMRGEGEREEGGDEHKDKDEKEEEEEEGGGRRLTLEAVTI